MFRKYNCETEDREYLEVDDLLIELPDGTIKRSKLNEWFKDQYAKREKFRKHIDNRYTITDFISKHNVNTEKYYKAYAARLWASLTDNDRMEFKSIRENTDVISTK